MTFSIVAHLPETGELGAAVATARPAVGNRVAFVRHRVGAAASQAAPNPWLALRALDVLATGRPADDVLVDVLRDEDRREIKQLLLVDANGHAAGYTGANATAWSGHIVGDGFVVAGNTLVGSQVVDAMAAAYSSAMGDLAEKLVRALEAGQAAGGDRRGRQSAAVTVIRASAAPFIDVRVDDHADPVPELRRILEVCRNTFPLVSLDPDVVAEGARTKVWPR